MDLANTKIAGVNIALVGSFNPQIFQPAWFAARDLIPREEGEHARINIIHPDIVSFGTDWFELSIEHERFSITTQSAPSYAPVRDLVLGTFGLLEHTPIERMGLNYMIHHKLKSQAVLQETLNVLAPPSCWDEVMIEPFGRTITVQGGRPDDHKGIFQVTVEPSLKVESAIFIATNDHVDFSDEASAEGAKAMIQALQDLWEPSGRRFESVVDRIVTLI